MNTDELIFLNAFNTIPGVGVATLRLLKSRFSNFQNAWRGDMRPLATGAFVKPIDHIIGMHATLDPEKEFKKLERYGIWMIHEEDSLFPPPLREIPHAPLLLYGRGAKPDTSRLMIGVVGTRKPTAYGKEVTETITKELAHAGMTVVSGLAVGIDTLAHQTTLDQQGVTIAVIGSGMSPNRLFPSQNIALADRIVASNGTVLSEYAPETPAAREYFPLRNRIIAGLSRGVLVVEARERSGALITAHIALEQNRDVFAVPGSIFSLTSAGANRLIQQGAKLITNAQDICEDWGIKTTGKTAASAHDLDNNEQIVVKLLEQELNIDDLGEKTGFEISFLMSLLTLLELKGHIRNTGNTTYQAIS